MVSRFRHSSALRIQRSWWLLCLVPILGLCSQKVQSQPAPVAGQPLAVPATFSRYVKAPGTADFIKRPSAVHWDRYHHELLVADSGHNRVVIFSAAGSYKFEFGLGDAVSVPADIATDPAGFIYVLGSSQAGRVLQRFDFDGLLLGAVALPVELEGLPVAPESMACGDDGLLYVLDNRARRILVISPVEGLVSHFLVGPKEDSGQELFGLGEIAIYGRELLIPVATSGTVLRFGLDGRPMDSVGHFGAKPGTLNFPVAAAVSPEGIIAVLDQGRFCVVCYSQSGRLLGEFGGKGVSPGWFINPSLLAIPSATSVVVGQIFENKIQICTLPEFVRGRNRTSVEDATGLLDTVDSAQTSDPRHTAKPSISLSRGSVDPHQPVTASHLEVSE